MGGGLSEDHMRDAEVNAILLEPLQVLLVRGLRAVGIEKSPEPPPIEEESRALLAVQVAVGMARHS